MALTSQVHVALSTLRWSYPLFSLLLLCTFALSQDCLMIYTYDRQQLRVLRREMFVLKLSVHVEVEVEGTGSNAVTAVLTRTAVGHANSARYTNVAVLVFLQCMSMLRGC